MTVQIMYEYPRNRRDKWPTSERDACGICRPVLPPMDADHTEFPQFPPHEIVQTPRASPFGAKVVELGADAVYTLLHSTRKCCKRLKCSEPPQCRRDLLSGKKKETVITDISERHVYHATIPQRSAIRTDSDISRRTKDEIQFSKIGRQVARNWIFIDPKMVMNAILSW